LSTVPTSAEAEWTSCGRLVIIKKARNKIIGQIVLDEKLCLESGLLPYFP
jgi:hypothetical protein